MNELIAEPTVRLVNMLDHERKLQQQISPLLAQLRAIKAEIRLERSPFQVGDIIQWDYRPGKTKTGRVLSLHDWSTCISWRVSLIRKDGSESLKEQMVYPFEGDNVRLKEKHGKTLCEVFAKEVENERTH